MNPFPKYLLIAYKPDSNDYCRGCHMASYSSDMEICECESQDELIQKIAGFLARKMRVNEAGYELTIYPKEDEWDLINSANSLAEDIIKKRVEDEKAEKVRLAEERRIEALEDKWELLEKLKKELGDS